jgi:hypothetical protein
MLTIDIKTLGSAYHELRQNAPARRQGYFSKSRTGTTSSLPGSNRGEELLAASLFVKNSLVLPSGERLSVLDYQFPLKSVRADEGVGKVDLLGVTDDGTLTVIELKVAGNREDRRIALLEGLIYAAIIEANIDQIAKEALAAREKFVRRSRPTILILAHNEFWSYRAAYPDADNFHFLLRDIAAEIPIKIEVATLDCNGHELTFR